MRTGKTSNPIRKINELVDFGLVTESEMPSLQAVTERFAVSITPEMLEVINPNDSLDPIALQFVPSAKELITMPEDEIDPIGDDRYTPVKGITHRYPDRVLLKLLHVCPVYCRFCFRREKIGPGSEYLSEAEKAIAINYIRNNEEIWEAVLTGGDPLMLNSNQLEKVFKELSEIKHLSVIRIHTRVPVVDTKRVSLNLIQSLKCNKAVYVVIHCNHPSELTKEVEAACAMFVDNGIPVLSQTALLKNVNDKAEVLENLFRKLVTMRVKPYYLHHTDLAVGTSHFRVRVKEGQEIMRTLRGNVSGICQPQYVLDIPNGYGKVPINYTYITPIGSDGEYIVEDYQGGTHRYPSQSKDSSQERP